jgi:hypothetical protein
VRPRSWRDRLSRSVCTRRSRKESQAYGTLRSGCLEDAETAHDVNLAWWALSQACHHGSYELPPTAPELEGLIDVVRRFVRSA